MMKNIKLFEEHFWQTEDNETADKIIDVLNKGINPKHLNGGYINQSKFHYEHKPAPITSDIDPLGEEDIEDKGFYIISSKQDPYYYYLYLFKHKNSKGVLLNTNRSRKIHNILRKAYKQKLKGDKKINKNKLEKFFEQYKNHHSFVDLLNLCKEVYDHIYNNQIIISDHFESFKEIKNGYEIIFNDKKKYFINIKNEKILDQNGDEKILDSVYEDIENLYSIIKYYDFNLTINQMDEKMKSFNDIMKLYKINESFIDEVKSKLSNEYSNLKDGVLKLLDDNLDGDLTKLQGFIEKYTEGDSDEILKGFIEDAEIFEFYLKYQSDIDQILLDNDYYDDSPDVESLYDYVIDGTYDAVVYCMEKIKEDLYE